MNKDEIIQRIGVIEILIGSSALLGNFISLALSLNTKTFNVLSFVIVTGCISVLIGIGILKFSKTAYDLLLYFSSIIILTKILVFFNIIELNGQLEISIHRALHIPLAEGFKNFMIGFKNAASVFYHAFVIYFLQQAEIKKLFVH